MLRRKDVMRVTGWGERAYYINTAGIRVRMMGYKEEERVPRSKLVMLLTANNQLT